MSNNITGYHQFSLKFRKVVRDNLEKCNEYVTAALITDRVIAQWKMLSDAEKLEYKKEETQAMYDKHKEIACKFYAENQDKINRLGDSVINNMANYVKSVKNTIAITLQLFDKRQNKTSYTEDLAQYTRFTDSYSDYIRMFPTDDIIIFCLTFWLNETHEIYRF